ncbi:MAG: DegT/DnrJ/EryC1/StrS family aminotransferase [Candidatus Kerfeldbacteria bacterium]|nr:DegT/DnrJ/EryC1/StrS family aminotransferase [Candidatus Kerfeldbacteria bacterium]
MKAINEIDFAYSLFVDKYNKYEQDDIDAAIAVLKSGRLFYPIGFHVVALEKRLKKEFSSRDCVLVTSGTAAVHVALGSIGIDFGDEVIVTPIGDTGTVLPIFLQGAIPVFADVDPKTMMITAETIRPKITSRTKAIIVVHYGGFPAEIKKIVELARKRNIAVVEDCAQAPSTFYEGKRIGTFGDVGSFSTNDTKHVSCGDGGFVICNTKKSARNAKLFRDKGFNRATKIRDPEIVAPNYRMTEIQAAILNSQWNKLEARVKQRASFAKGIEKIVKKTSWLHTFPSHRNDRSSYFLYLFFLDEKAPVTRDKLCKELCKVGIPARRGNLYDVLYKLNIFKSKLPRYMQIFNHPVYREGLCPEAESANARMVRLEMLEIFGEEEIMTFAKLIHKHATRKHS